MDLTLILTRKNIKSLEGVQMSMGLAARQHQNLAMDRW